jgi:RNA polymerase sigma factor (sigma-70 family)
MKLNKPFIYLYLIGGDKLSDSELNKVVTTIYEATYNDVLRYIVAKCRSADDVQDLIQNTYLNFYNRLTKGGVVKESKKYLIKIARNEVYKLYGYFSFTKNSIPVFSQTDDEDFSNYELEAFSKEADYNELLCDELWDYLKKGDILTFKIFVLYYNQDLKISDIAKMLKVKESTIKNRLYRTIKQMRELFSMEGCEF